jgi:hypothetical protein
MLLGQAGAGSDQAAVRAVQVVEQLGEDGDGAAFGGCVDGGYG